MTWRGYGRRGHSVAVPCCLQPKALGHCRHVSLYTLHANFNFQQVSIGQRNSREFGQVIRAFRDSESSHRLLCLGNVEMRHSCFNLCTLSWSAGDRLCFDVLIYQQLFLKKPAERFTPLLQIRNKIDNYDLLGYSVLQPGRTLPKFRKNPLFPYHGNYVAHNPPHNMKPSFKRTVIFIIHSRKNLKFQTRKPRLTSVYKPMSYGRNVRSFLIRTQFPMRIRAADA